MINTFSLSDFAAVLVFDVGGHSLIIKHFNGGQTCTYEQKQI